MNMDEWAVISDGGYLDFDGTIARLRTIQCVIDDALAGG